MATKNYAAVVGELQDLMGRRPAMQAGEVVSYARYNPDSALRRAFDARRLFDDVEAAEQARLAFARHLIQRVKVKVVTPDRPPVALRVYVNLGEERLTEAGGYRLRAEVLVDEERLAMMRRDFTTGLESLIRRFTDILTLEQEAALRQVGAQVAGVATDRAPGRGPALEALMRKGR